MSELRFDGKVIAITGAAQGMGREHALLLAQRGAKVLVNDIKGAGETVEAVRAIGGEAAENRSDITDASQTDQIVEEALDRWGRLDGVVNNAATYGASIADPEITQRVIGVHLIGTINMVRSAMDTFTAQGYGRIVNVGSGSMFGFPGTATYAATKGGIFGFTRGLAKDLELLPQDIKANLIMPAALTEAMPRVPDVEFQAMLDNALAPRKISPLVALLLHEECPSNGEAIQVGAGRQARVILETTEGWAADDAEGPTPESILEHWAEVVANRDKREPAGSMSDLLGRRGLYPYSTNDLVQWAITGIDPATTTH